MERSGGVNPAPGGHQLQIEKYLRSLVEAKPQVPNYPCGRATTAPDARANARKPARSDSGALSTGGLL
eukprot:CAMPEP_0197922304 /NCGR_PEP_ID=MMETSP1439-20131203/92126_1 /TAXON_ID=66791 /ORGANISM="Gonyaulax spinifera, Strain CCMP409" /LENGTH=67 /DNA_ID=CAMNT_0043544603 /DNA_START=30 /DNA_END=231 /DNA_ORIENTATION=-